MFQTARRNMLTLQLEPADDLAKPLFCNAASCAEWLKQFQLTNLQRAHNQLLTQVNELNRYPMPGMERLDTLELLRSTDADNPLAGDPIPAFLFQAAPEFKTPSSLIIPRDWFKPGRVVDILHQNGEEQHAIMGFSVERGADYERVSFKLV